MNNNYIVTWRVEITAPTKKDAALQAREIQLNPNNKATVYEVSEDVDVSVEDEA